LHAWKKLMSPSVFHENDGRSAATGLHSSSSSSSSRSGRTMMGAAALLFAASPSPHSAAAADQPPEVCLAPCAEGSILDLLDLQ
jgi:hypothetical protein